MTTNNKVKIIAFGDTHTKHGQVENLPDADMLIFTGDCMGGGYNLYELEDFLHWYNSLDYPYKIMIAGNHDRWIENNPDDFRGLLKTSYKSIIYLEDESINIMGFNIYGTPHTKMFCNWAFNKNSLDLEELFDKIPDNTNILVSHGPQFGILDRLDNGYCCGDWQLNKNVNRLNSLKLHLHGHIHCGYGMVDNGKYITYNCSVLDEDYKMKNSPHLIEISLP